MPLVRILSWLKNLFDASQCSPRRTGTIMRVAMDVCGTAMDVDLGVRRGAASWIVHRAGRAEGQRLNRDRSDDTQEADKSLGAQSHDLTISAHSRRRFESEHEDNAIRLPTKEPEESTWARYRVAGGPMGNLPLAYMAPKRATGIEPATFSLGM